MPKTRTTLTLDTEVLNQAQQRYRDLGFDRVGELVTEATRDYLRRRRVEEKNALMREAARDPRYLAVLRQVSEDFASIDAENLPPEY
jgi:metal-responsive CopG/Arc/MetJ family transcriptional regulator